MNATSDEITEILRQEAKNPDRTAAVRRLFADADAVDTTLRACGREWEALIVAKLALALRDAVADQDGARYRFLRTLARTDSAAYRALDCGDGAFTDADWDRVVDTVRANNLGIRP